MLLLDAVCLNCYVLFLVSLQQSLGIITLNFFVITMNNLNLLNLFCAHDVICAYRILLFQIGKTDIVK